MEEHVRDLYAFLREYGATGMHLGSGGKHAKLCFTFKNEDYTYPINRRTPGSWRAVDNMIRDLKCMLGPPIVVPPKQPRTLESMMHELNGSTGVLTVKAVEEGVEVPRSIEEHIADMLGEPTEKPDIAYSIQPKLPLPHMNMTARTWSIKLAAYRQPGYSSVVYMIFPVEVRDLYPGDMKIERLDDENWKISSGGASRFSKYHGQRTKITYVDNGVEPFSSTPAEAVEVGGEILVFLAMDKRRHMVKHYVPNEPELPMGAIPRPQKEPEAVAMPFPKDSPVADQFPPSPTEVTLRVLSKAEVEMRDLARRVRAMELTCPYRFTRKDDGRWVWIAPEIGE